MRAPPKALLALALAMEAPWKSLERTHTRSLTYPLNQARTTRRYKKHDMHYSVREISLVREKYYKHHSHNQNVLKHHSHLLLQGTAPGPGRTRRTS